MKLIKTNKQTVQYSTVQYSTVSINHHKACREWHSTTAPWEFRIWWKMTKLFDHHIYNRVKKQFRCSNYPLSRLWGRKTKKDKTVEKESEDIRQTFATHVLALILTNFGGKILPLLAGKSLYFWPENLSKSLW